MKKYCTYTFTYIHFSILGLKPHMLSEHVWPSLNHLRTQIVKCYTPQQKFPRPSDLQLMLLWIYTHFMGTMEFLAEMGDYE